MYDLFEEEKNFNLTTYQAQLSELLKSYTSAAYEAFVSDVVQTVDRQRISAASEEPGLFDMGGVYPLGKSERATKRYSLISHAEMAMAIDDANLEAVTEANRKKHDELERLRPYWDHPGVTKQQAVAAYYAAYPESAAGH